MAASLPLATSLCHESRDNRVITRIEGPGCEHPGPESFASQRVYFITTIFLVWT